MLAKEFKTILISDLQDIKERKTEVDQPNQPNLIQNTNLKILSKRRNYSVEFQTFKTMQEYNHHQISSVSLEFDNFRCALF